MSAIVWFSGISALNLVDQVPHGQYEEIACNRFDEWRTVKHLVAYDRQMVESIECQPQYQYHTQAKWRKDAWHAIKWNKQTTPISDSGTLAVELARQQGHQTIYIIGCDWQSTDVSLQQHHYEFRGHTPAKFTNQHQWLDHQQDLVWVHLVKQPFMQRFMHHTDFLAMAESTRH